MFREFELNEGNIEKQKEIVLEIIKENEKKIKELLELENKTYENFITPYQLMHERLNFYFSPISHLNSVKNSKKTQEVYSSLLPVLTEYYAKLGQNRNLYEACKKIYKEDLNLNREQKKVLEDLILEFELSGVGLEEKKQEELKEIMIKLSDLQNRFSQNLLDATNAYEMIVEDKEELSELPKSDLENAKIKKEGREVYRFTLQQPSYVAYMTYGKNRKNREKIYKAYVTRAPQNEEILEEILELRFKKANLLGFKNYAELSLKKKMASSPKEVIKFLKDLAKKSKNQAKKEFKELFEFARANGFEDESLQSFDLAYYAEKLKKEKFSVNDEDYMPYFEKSRVVRGLFDFIEELFKISFKKVETSVWDEKVEVYELSKDGKLIGRLYLDLEARKNKRGGAWMDEWVTHHINEKGERIFPVAYIVANFSPSKENSPSLLKPNDVETLFHETGHALHHLLSEVKEPFVSGINGVEWDAVEFPSQFLENFAYEERILEKFAYHYKTKEPLSKDMIRKLKKAKNFQSALAMLRQIEFALFDMLIHMGKYSAKEVQEILDKVREEVAVIKPPSYNKFQWGFAHIFAGGYAAGYYSYKWAEVLSADAYVMFSDNGIFNEELAESFYEEILKVGGSREAMESFLKFKGEKPNIDSLLKISEIEE